MNENQDFIRLKLHSDPDCRLVIDDENPHAKDVCCFCGGLVWDVSMFVIVRESDGANVCENCVYRYAPSLAGLAAAMNEFLLQARHLAGMADYMTGLIASGEAYQHSNDTLIELLTERAKIAAQNDPQGQAEINAIYRSMKG